jgi:hypothetical protein
MSARDFSHQLGSRISSSQAEAAETFEAISQPANGWTWTCDARGRFTYCSPEVESALGVPAAAMIGKRLAEFQLAPASAEVLQQTLLDLFDHPVFPSETPVTYLDNRGETLAAQLIFIGPDRGNPLGGWRGFTQVRAEAEAPPIPVTGELAEVETESPPVTHSYAEALPTLQVAYQESDYMEASQNLREQLERLRCLAAGVVSARYSRIHSLSSITHEDDRQHPLPDKSYLLGREVTHYPKITVFTFKHRLEWGDKLEPTPAEKRLLEDKRHAAGLLSRLGRASAPKAILLERKSWVDIQLRIENGGGNQLTISQAGGAGEMLIDVLDILLNEPDSLLPILSLALRHPQKSETWAYRGRDYLIAD